MTNRRSPGTPPIVRPLPPLKEGEVREGSFFLYRDWYISDGGDGWMYGQRAGSPIFRGRDSASVERQIEAYRAYQMIDWP